MEIVDKLFVAIRELEAWSFDRPSPENSPPGRPAVLTAPLRIGDKNTMQTSCVFPVSVLLAVLAGCSTSSSPAPTDAGAKPGDATDMTDSPAETPDAEVDAGRPVPEAGACFPTDYKLPRTGKSCGPGQI